MDKIEVRNRKALRDYQVLKVWESGIELKGSEVKSIREARANLNDSFARLEKGEILLYNMHISEYNQASFFNVEPRRVRRLLLHKNQIKKIASEVFQRGLTLVPLRLYFNERGFVKIELALCRGKKLYDRRQDMKRREVDLEIRRAMRNRRRS
ncbi:MAG: SsrA-binding protein SmpB [Candidatus Omnitrophota bacterium]|jgi:SsrA-binding protein